MANIKQAEADVLLGTVRDWIKSKFYPKSDKIAKSDLASGVQTSLDKADSALQSVPNTYRTAFAQDAIDSGKVDKVFGKGLSTNDYTTEEKSKLASLENYDDSAIDGRVTELEEDIDKVVLNGMTASEDGSTVKLSLSKINIRTGATSSVDVPLPVASAADAGILNPQTYQTIMSNQTLINAIVGASVAVSGLAASPTQQQVTTAWLTASGVTALVNGARLFDVTNTRVWTYYTNTEVWYSVEAESGGSVVIAQWTNSALGTVKGVADNAGHTNDGKLMAESDGTGSVLGWDRLVARVQTIEGKEAGWDAKQDAISDLASIRTGAAAGATAYQKPSSGIPASDLVSSYGDSKNPYGSKTANHALMAPNGSNGVPTFRAIVVNDVSDVEFLTSAEMLAILDA